MKPFFPGKIFFFFGKSPFYHFWNVDSLCSLHSNSQTHKVRKASARPQWPQATPLRGVCGFLQNASLLFPQWPASNVKRYVIYSRTYHTIWQGNCIHCFPLIQSRKSLSNFCAPALAFYMSLTVWESLLRLSNFRVRFNKSLLWNSQSKGWECSSFSELSFP